MIDKKKRSLLIEFVDNICEQCNKRFPNSQLEIHRIRDNHSLQTKQDECFGKELRDGRSIVPILSHELPKTSRMRNKTADTNIINKWRYKNGKKKR